jgi:UDP-N-acetylglucosamine--N-acetylmuramyl-(pentapeptide) pyrophosphoryl-undecaprenol N-acetylglucosamine transferase
MPSATPTHLAWFVGDGTGARTRFAAVLPHLTGMRVSLVTVGPAGEVPAGLDDVVELPWGVLGGDGSTRRDPSRLRTWLASDRPDLLVVDGSGEVAAAARAVGVPTVRIRRPGTGTARVTGVLEAVGTGEIAPYPPVLEPPATPTWLRERTVHAGLLSRFAGRRPHRRAGRRALGIAPEAAVVTVLCGRDGLGCPADLAAAAEASPRWTWLVLGRCGSATTVLPANLLRLGWRDDPWPALEAADVVVGSGALSVVAEVASAERPLVVVPRPGRADDEEHARLLAEAGAAHHAPRWPAPGAWAPLLDRLAGSDADALSRLDDRRGPARAADWLRSWARTPPHGAPSGRATTDGGHHRARLDRILDLGEPPTPATDRR